MLMATKIQRYKDANALYAFKSRGFGGEIELVVAYNTLSKVTLTTF